MWKLFQSIEWRWLKSITLKTILVPWIAVEYHDTAINMASTSSFCGWVVVSTTFDLFDSYWISLMESAKLISFVFVQSYFSQPSDFWKRNIDLYRKCNLLLKWNTTMSIPYDKRLVKRKVFRSQKKRPMHFSDTLRG